MIVISPHLDDAVLSCGQALAATPDSVVITVFAGVPKSELPLTNFDVQSGFKAAHEAVESRRAEDRRACAVLSATAVHLDFLDRQYAVPSEDEAIIDALVIELTGHQDQTILVPLGLMHPDHVQVNRCARVAIAQIDGRPIFYEDLPSRVLWPESVDVAGLEWYGILPAGDIYLKEAAMACYRSQAWALDRHACLVPERFWRSVSE